MIRVLCLLPPVRMISTMLVHSAGSTGPSVLPTVCDLSILRSPQNPETTTVMNPTWLRLVNQECPEPADLWAPEHQHVGGHLQHTATCEAGVLTLNL
jgi:hypothetical protein